MTYEFEYKPGDFIAIDDVEYIVQEITIFRTFALYIVMDESGNEYEVDPVTLKIIH